MENETLEILKELRDNIKSLKSQETNAWHKHPIFISIITLVIGAIFMGISGWATIPSENKVAIEANKQLIKDHVKDDQVKWDRLDARLSTINDNFEFIHDVIQVKPSLSTIKPIGD